MEDYSFYPDKPQLKKKETRNSLGVTLFSMALFVLVTLYIFPKFISFILILLGVLLIHELGHFLLMKLFKYENVKMLFIPLMGAFVSGQKERYSQKQSLIVVLAGPIPGVVFGVISFFLAQSYQLDWLMTASLLFLFLNLMNLVPLDPLDGGQLLRLLVKKKKDLFQFIFSLISSLMMIGLGFYLKSYVLIGFGFLMAFRVRSHQKNYQIREELREDNVEFETTYKDLNNKQYAQIKEIVLNNTPALQKYISMSEDQNVDPIVAAQVNNALSPPMKYDATLLLKVVMVLIWLSAIVLPIFFLLNSNIDWYGSSIEGWR